MGGVSGQSWWDAAGAGLGADASAGNLSECKSWHPPQPSVVSVEGVGAPGRGISCRCWGSRPTDTCRFLLGTDCLGAKYVVSGSEEVLCLRD